MSYQVCRVSTAWSPLGTATGDFVVSRLSRSLPMSEYHSRAPSLPLSSIPCLRFGRGMMTPVEPAAPIAAGWSFTVAVVLRLTTLGVTKPRAYLSQTFMGPGWLPRPHWRPSQEPLDMIVQKPGLASPVVLELSLIHISEPTRLGMISYAVFCL